MMKVRLTIKVDDESEAYYMKLRNYFVGFVEDESEAYRYEA